MEYLIELRKAAGKTQKDMAAYLGVSRQAYANYENDVRKPDFETLLKLGEYFKVSVDYLLRGKENPGSIPPGFEPLPTMVQVPLIGRIACGDPITAEENVEDLVSIPAMWHADFTLLCEGDSMAPRIQDGDLVAIRIQPIVENGEVAAVRIENEATLKRVYLYPDRMVLQPENQSYAPIVLVGEEINTVSIEGKAVGLCRGL